MKDSVFIGIGSSAGGLEALQKLLPLLPSDENYIYVIAQHLHPKKKSALSTILSHHTAMPVQTISKKQLFKPNNIYIIPSTSNLFYKKSKLILEEVTNAVHVPMPSIDTLFESLSNYKKEKCVGIILSGTGHDGTKGIEQIKKNGGITIVQSPQEAKHSAMPQNAIDSGYVDYVFEIAKIAKNLDSIIQSLPASWMYIEKLLKEKEHLDTRKYKNETIMRRLAKRMLLTKTKNIDEYVHYLQTHSEELHLLYQNILIGVTEFFRDKDSFDILKKQLTYYLQDKPENYDLRIWSVACSTGEEAYSLAILVHQISQELNKKLTLHIFATDIDENALSVAKKGIYTKESLHSMEKTVLKNYFIESEGTYKIKEFIRSQIVFTHHNILNEPPFINQDLISCRNFLIYILPKAQQELFALFHYALKEDGLLFLGSSEAMLTSIQYFKALSSESKIYIKEKLKNPPRISSHYFEKHLQEKESASLSPTEKMQDVTMEENITKAIFTIFSPECIVVDASFSIVYKKGSNSFLTLPDGFVSLNIIENLQQELRYSVKKLLNTVFKTSVPASTRFIQTALENKKQTFVKIIAYPFQNNNQTSFVMLYFQELDSNNLELNINEIISLNDTAIVENLSTQLQELKEDNHTLLDKLTISKENMQLLNEELQSSNEELQSSNEELETSNEELQSSNEELQSSMIHEQQLQRHLSLILNSTHDGIMGLDLEGRHTFVNKAALTMLGFKESELLGKNAHLLWHHSKSDGAPYSLEECTLHNHLKKGISIRREDLFFKKDGTPLNVEVLQNPFIENGIIKGAVLSFHDITQKKKLQKELEYEHELADLYVDTTETIVMILNTDGSIVNINRKGCTLLGLPREKLIGKNFIQDFIPKELEDKITNVLRVNINEQTPQLKKYTIKIIDANQQEHLISWTNSPIKNKNGTITSMITSGVDITNEAALSHKLFKQEHLYKLTFEEADIGIAHASLDGKWIDTNEYLSELLGYTKDEFKTMSISDITYKEDRQTDTQMIQELLQKKKKSYHIEKRYIHKNGNIIWVSLAVVLLRDEQGEPLYLLKIIRDISQLKLLMYQLNLERNRFEKIIEFAPIPLMLYDEDGNILLLNKSFRDSSGYTLKDMPTIDKLVETFFVNKNRQVLQQIKEHYRDPTKLLKEKQIIRTKSNKERIGIPNAVKLDDNNLAGKSTYLIAINDITEIQQKDELMIAQSRQAAMGDMLSMIAHQWRQPLSVISMVANNVKAKIELQGSIDSKTLQELIITLNEQTQYLSHTIDDFRNFFKPDKQKEIISVDSIVEKFQHLIQKSLDNNAIHLKLSHKTKMKLCTYQNQLLQVLINILNNAKDAIKENREEDGYINVDITQTKTEVVFKICDNGGGIKPEIKEKLGEPYITTKEKNGTGLGIYMSKIIVEKHLKGRLFWESDDKGSCFYIAVPSTDTCK